MFRRLIQRIVAFAHLRRGIRLYRAGRFARAGAHIHAALHRGGPSFLAHLYLGKIYLRLSRFDRARAEFARAKALDPRRYEAQGLPEDVLLQMAERFYQPLWRKGEDHTPAVPKRTASARSELGADDFSSPAERERFRALPPIRREDIEEIDWDEVQSLFDR